jgi:rubrerythrin
MNKKDLIDKLKVGITIEKTAIPLYTRHINSPHFMSAFSKEKQIAIKKILRHLCDQSIKHKKRIEQIIKQVENTDNDVF